MSYKGALTGGYYDKRRSKLELQQSIRSLESQMTEAEAKIGEIQGKLANVEGEITKTVNDLYKAEQNASKARYLNVSRLMTAHPLRKYTASLLRKSRYL